MVVVEADALRSFASLRITVKQRLPLKGKAFEGALQTYNPQFARRNKKWPHPFGCGHFDL